MLDKYVKAFDPSFEALYGSLEETAATAKEFGVFYEKVPSGDTYTLSHTALRLRLQGQLAPRAVRVPYRKRVRRRPAHRHGGLLMTSLYAKRFKQLALGFCP